MFGLAGGLPIQALTDHLKCDLFQPKGGPYARGPTVLTGRGKLTAYWTQEMIGADLATEFLDKYDQEHPTQPSQAVPIGVIDTEFNVKWFPKDKMISQAAEIRELPYGPKDNLAHGWHGTHAASLIIADSPVGTGSRARISRIFSAVDPHQAEGAALAMTQGPLQPRLVQMSMSCHALDGYCPKFNPSHFKAITDQSVLVMTAGNYFPLKPDQIAHELRPIVVGSMNAFGLMSHTSQEGDPVVISAPSDFGVQSYGPMKDDRHTSPSADKVLKNGTTFKKGYIYNTDLFAQTSAAAPQVSGALTNVLSLLPGVTTDELKTMLKQTAVKTSAFLPDNGKNGAGALNAYRLARAAARLKDGGWPKNRGLVGDARTYDFSEDAERIRKNAEKLLDQLLCSNQRLALQLFRKAFFLNPSDTRTREVLSDLYEKHGFHAQSIYVAQKPLKDALQEIPDKGYRDAMIQRNLLHVEAVDWEWDTEEFDRDICHPDTWKDFKRLPPKGRC